MNKKAIFIPLLLLIAQPNRILGADDLTLYEPENVDLHEPLSFDIFEEAKEAVEMHLQKVRTQGKVKIYEAPIYFKFSGKITSDNPDVQTLLDMCEQDGSNEYEMDCLTIIGQSYPNEISYPTKDVEGVEHFLEKILGLKKPFEQPLFPGIKVAN